MRPVRPGNAGLWNAVGGQRNASVRVHEPETVCVFDEGGMTVERYSDEAIRILDDLHTERIDYHSEYLPLIDAVQRLDAYESTGMEPDDLKRIFNEDALLKMTGNFLGIAPDRLRELAQADREGRCVESGYPQGKLVASAQGAIIWNLNTV